MLSIITVVYNDISGVKSTVNSLLYQVDYENFKELGLVEYTVIDGGSIDGTIEFLLSHSNDLINFHSGKDAGIYDAMNKGLIFCRGDWIYFLNAGDTFASEHVLTNLLSVINSLDESQNFLYGTYQSYGQVYNQRCNLLFLISHMINHQSIIYHRSLLKYGYDLRYRFCADYAHLLSVWPQLKPKELDLCIANFDTTGVSSQASNKTRMWQERLQAVWRSDLKFAQKILLSTRGVVAWPYHYLKNLLVRLNK